MKDQNIYLFLDLIIGNLCKPIDCPKISYLIGTYEDIFFHDGFL